MKNNMKKIFRKANFLKGFTLIELLVVIAIIGVLATIVLTSLTKTQGRSYDTKIKEQLNGFRTSAQMYFTNHSGYGPATSVCDGQTDTTIFNNLQATDGTPGLYLATGNMPDFSQVSCDASLTEYAVKATLYSGTEYWCVDSTGASRQITGTPASGTVCP
jgi:prepilin-type N-terminal cleavage/methylation domain-containing protein